MKNALKVTDKRKFAKKDEETLFKKLAEKTKNLSLNEKIAIILEVKNGDRPTPDLLDINYNGFYLINGYSMEWTTYALTKIRAVERNKKKGLYYSRNGSI